MNLLYLINWVVVNVKKKNYNVIIYYIMTDNNRIPFSTRALGLTIGQATNLFTKNFDASFNDLDVTGNLDVNGNIKVTGKINGIQNVFTESVGGSTAGSITTLTSGNPASSSIIGGKIITQDDGDPNVNKQFKFSCGEGTRERSIVIQENQPISINNDLGVYNNLSVGGRIQIGSGGGSSGLAGQVITSNGSSSGASWSSSTNITSVGTLSSLTVTGDSNVNGLIKLNSLSGTAGSILTSNGTSDPTWTEPIAFKATNPAAGNATGGVGLLLFSNNLTDVVGGNRASFQQGTSYDTSTGYFTAPYNGLYYFHTSLLWATGSFVATFVTLMIGPSTISTGDDAFIISQAGGNEAFNNAFTQNADGIVKLTAGEKVGVFIQIGGGSGSTWAITKKFCVFGGYLIQKL